MFYTKLTGLEYFFLLNVLLFVNRFSTLSVFMLIVIIEQNTTQTIKN